MFEGERIVICEDAHKWLPDNKNLGCIITSMPDMEEVGLDMDAWLIWVKKTCGLLMQSLDETGLIFFYQTDRKYKGTVIDKKSLITQQFVEAGYKNILSKIVLKQEPETANLYRPTYTNLFCFSKTVLAGKATPDVIYAGKMLYKNAMGFNAVKACIDFVQDKTDHKCIYDPFCGQGSVLKIANLSGFNAVGVDIDQNQCTLAIKN